MNTASPPTHIMCRNKYKEEITNCGYDIPTHNDLAALTPKIFSCIKITLSMHLNACISVFGGRGVAVNKLSKIYK